MYVKLGRPEPVIGIFSWPCSPVIEPMCDCLLACPRPPCVCLAVVPSNMFVGHACYEST